MSTGGRDYHTDKYSKYTVEHAVYELKLDIISQLY